MDDLDRKLRLTQRLDQRLLVAAGRLDHDTRHAGPVRKPLDQRGNGIGAICVMGAIAPMPCHIQARSADVDTDEDIVRKMRELSCCSCLVREAGPAPGSSNVRPALATVRVSGPSIKRGGVRDSDGR